MARTTGGGDFTHVKATADEVAAYVKRAGRQPSVHRVACNACGKRVWGSGMGIGSHRKACPGPACEHCEHGQYHHDWRTGHCAECACKRMTYAEAEQADAVVETPPPAPMPEEAAPTTTRRRTRRGRTTIDTPPPAGAAMLDLGSLVVAARTPVRVAPAGQDGAFHGTLMDVWMKDGTPHAAMVFDGRMVRHVYVDRVTPAEQ